MAKERQELDLRMLRDSIRPESFDHTILCFARGIGIDAIEASLDFGETWVSLPLNEVISANVIKDVRLPKATYQLVRLVLAEAHPEIELAAMSTQVRMMQSAGGCGHAGPRSRDGAPGGMGRQPWPTPRLEEGGFCRDLCANETGCNYINCLFWCAFLRD